MTLAKYAKLRAYIENSNENIGRAPGVPPLPDPKDLTQDQISELRQEILPWLRPYNKVWINAGFTDAEQNSFRRNLQAVLKDLAALSLPTRRFTVGCCYSMPAGVPGCHHYFDVVKRTETTVTLKFHEMKKFRVADVVCKNGFEQCVPLDKFAVETVLYANNLLS
jgi:hypothetical protein